MTVMTMTTTETNFSDLLRRPHDVLERLREGDVLLRRRGEDSLLLMPARRSEARREGMALVAHLLGEVAQLDTEGAVLRRALAERFPWSRFLPEADREAFYAEFVETARACADVDTLEPLAQLVHEWKQTAQVHADPELAERLREPAAGDGDLVTAPSAR